MPLTLSDEDRAAIDAAYDAAFNPLDRGFARECEAIYLAGMRAGIARAAKVIETASSSPSFGLRARWIAAIRALLD